MKRKNDHTHENGSNSPSAYENGGTQRGIVEGLYILKNKKSRILLDLGGGNIASATPCQGWQCSYDHGMDHQLWALKRVGLSGSYRLMSLHDARFLDLISGKQEDGSLVWAFQYVGEGSGRSHQEWIISDEGAGFYGLRNAKTGTYLEIQEGKSGDGTKVTCSGRVDGGDHQLWDLERASRTTLDIKSILRSWKPDVVPCLFQPQKDQNEYIILPSDLRNSIWNGTNLLRQAVRGSIFDYDSFVIKAKDAVNTWARDRIRVDGYSILFGIVFGEANQGPKAYNWYLSSDMQALVFFDPQTGREYTTGGLEYFGFEPSFIMF